MPSSDPSAPARAQFDSIEDTIESFKSGNFIIVLDSPSRENEGDLIIAAEDLTPAKMSFMIRHTSGLICAPLLPHLADTLSLPQMVPNTSNQDPNRTAYTISIDANRPETTTGISAADRALTCNLLAREDATAQDFRRPGHVFPLRAKEGLIRQRRGHTEAAVECCRLAGKKLVGVISEIVEDGVEVEGVPEREGGGMMRRDALLEFGRRWGLRVCTIEDLVEFVEKREGKLEGMGEEGVNGA